MYKFNKLEAMLKDKYAKKLKDVQPKGRATAELDASKNPMKALKDKSYLSLKGKKGIEV